MVGLERLEHAAPALYAKRSANGAVYASFFMFRSGASTVLASLFVNSSHYVKVALRKVT